ncbi:hypothetical protein WJX84_010760 [Apatococcus fuscideae]|uniref:Protein kinase domain-containing protein n=1 Tax=Apatococcus fuscideae TaxID=2026836 RepID=A0AAW1TDU9_9CHLO
MTELRMVDDEGQTVSVRACNKGQVELRKLSIPALSASPTSLLGPGFSRSARRRLQGTPIRCSTPPDSFREAAPSADKIPKRVLLHNLAARLGQSLVAGRNREAIRGHATHVLSKECNLADELPDVIYAQRLTALEYYGNLASFCGCLNDNPGGLMEGSWSPLHSLDQSDSPISSPAARWFAMELDENHMRSLTSRPASHRSAAGSSTGSMMPRRALRSHVEAVCSCFIQLRILEFLVRELALEYRVQNRFGHGSRRPSNSISRLPSSGSLSLTPSKRPPVVLAFSPSIEEPSTPSPRRARPSLGTARLPSFVPKLALGAMAPSDQSSALSSRQGRPTSRFHPEFVAKTTASANPAASLLLPKLSLAGLQCHTAAPGPSESSRQMLSHRSTPEPGLPVSIMPLSPSLATLPSSVGLPEEEQVHPAVPMIDIAGAARMAQARGLGPKSSQPCSERAHPTRLMMTPRKKPWSATDRAERSPRNGINSPRIAARHSSQDESDSSSDSEHGSPRHKAPTNILEGYKRGYDMEEDMEQDLAAEGLRTDADTSDDDASDQLAASEHPEQIRPASSTRSAKEADGRLRSKIQVVDMVLVGLLDRHGQLDARLVPDRPQEQHLVDMPAILQAHLSHAANQNILSELRMQISRSRPAARLLRLLAAPLFDSSIYTQIRHIGKGAYANVYRFQNNHDDRQVAIKVIERQSNDVSCQHLSIFAEVSIMEEMRDCEWTADLLDYGLMGQDWWLVMPLYAASLKQWRSRQPLGIGDRLPLYSALFVQLLQAVMALHQKRVVHYDLKLENVLLDCIPGLPDREFWHPPGTAHPCFKVVLTDFGESRRFGPDEPAVTTRDRGTLHTKSPEMLEAANAAKTWANSFDRRKLRGAGAPSDVWSLGCLLYELLTGTILFDEGDEASVSLKVLHAHPLLSPQKLTALEGCPGAASLLHFMLVRDPRRRPTLPDIMHRLERNPLC